MQVNGLDHINIVTEDLAGTARFYAELLDLEVRDGPPGLDPAKVQWAYDRQGRALIHLNATDAFQPFAGRDARALETTGALHHVAFNCTGHEAMVARLDARGMEYRRNLVPSIGLVQLFVIDPHGVLLELNFYEG